MRMLRSPRIWLLILLVPVVLAGCSHRAEKGGEASTSPGSGGRYQGKDKDWGPDHEIDMSNVPDAVPRYELRTIAGNKNPYTVLGKTYFLMDDERAYKERGTASWYGYKFNGERTSNGELYDMFSMTGAHKTLPIPSYVRVTNLDNHKTVVVRINDRGPFHDGRIIDLSYAAAQRLGITRNGTGNVEVEVVVPDDDPRPPLRRKELIAGKAGSKQNLAADSANKQVIEKAVADQASGIVTKAEAGVTAAEPALPPGTYLQIGAFGVEASAKQFAKTVGGKIDYPVVINKVVSPQRLFRVRIGPFKDAAGLQAARDQLQKIDILQTHVVYQ